MTAIEIHRNAPSRDDAPRAGFPMALLFWAHVAGVSAGIAAGVGGGFGVFASLGIAWATAVALTLTLPFLPLIGAGFRNAAGAKDVDADLAAWAEDLEAERAAAEARNRRAA